MGLTLSRATVVVVDVPAASTGGAGVSWLAGADPKLASLTPASPALVTGHELGYSAAHASVVQALLLVACTATHGENGKCLIF